MVYWLLRWRLAILVGIKEVRSDAAPTWEKIEITVIFSGSSHDPVGAS
jgi:hypothetical protein